MSMTPSSFQQAEYLGAPDTALEPDPTALARALVFGVVGAAVGGFIYAAFVGITHIQLSLLLIGVAYLVAKAMMIGSKERGGIDYQIAAIVLTCGAVAFGNGLLLWWAVHQRGEVSLPVWVLAKYGLMLPFLEFRNSPGGAILGLFILFIGLRAAWRMTSGLPGASKHPFRR